MTTSSNFNKIPALNIDRRFRLRLK
ncbi:unnamed protein product, partial [Rotaria magnacalcarata]